MTLPGFGIVVLTVAADTRFVALDPGFAFASSITSRRMLTIPLVLAWREHLGLSQAEVAEKAGMKQPALSRIENAFNGAPSENNPFLTEKLTIQRKPVYRVNSLYAKWRDFCYNCHGRWFMDSIGTSLNDLVSSILRGSRSLPVEQFQDWVLERVKSEIPFDACQWITGSIQNHIPVAHSVHLHNLPTDSIADCAYQFHTNDPFVRKVLEHPGKTFDVYETMNRSQFVQSEFYQCHRKSRKIEHAIATAVVDQTSKLLNITAFYRHDYSTPFTSREKKIKSFISPVFVEAYNINLIVNLFRNVKDMNGIGAVCDGKGVLREAGPGLANLIHQEWPDWQGPILNFSPDELLQGKTEARFDGKKITVSMSTQHDLVLLEFRKKRKIDALTPSEHSVTHHLVQGMSNKEIATKIGISTKTVDNHLQHIYAKLNISNRKRAIVLLKDEF